MTTEDFVEHDRCARFHTWNARYAPFRVSAHFALNEAIHDAIAANSPIAASDKVMSLAASPGIDIPGTNLYPAVVHHSKLAEVIAAYALSVEARPVPALSFKWGEFTPRSFLLPDGRLRRIVLVDRWSPEREQLERFSWRTAADCALTNRPMLITAIVIGSMQKGFRPSPWTQGYVHPANGGIRVARRSGEFSDSWPKVYREHTALSALEWLRIMQSDGAFEGRVFSIVEEPPRAEVLGQIERMAREIASGSLDQTRSACYRFTPCPFLGCCAANRTPPELGWTEKPTLSNPRMVSLP